MTDIDPLNLTPHQKQSITMRKRHGPDIWREIGKFSKGGGFNDPEVARRAALKMHALKKLKKEQKENKDEPDTPTNPEEG